MDIEFKSPEEIKKFQEQLLRGALDYLATHSRYYQRVFKDNGIDVSEILHPFLQSPVTPAALI